jgi:hypothetical protein
VIQPFFWKDDWNSRILQELFPCLFSFVQNEDIFMSGNSVLLTMLLMFSICPYLQKRFISLRRFSRSRTCSLNFSNNDNDNDVYTFQCGDSYSSRKCYKFVHRLINPPTPFVWIWKSKLWLKHKVFAWLLLSDRLNTRILKRRHFNIVNNFQCSLCTSGDEETLEHLFFSCPFIIY